MAKFTIWLGDGWPGPYIVERWTSKNHSFLTVVPHAVDMEDAMRKAIEIIPDPPGVTRWELRVAYSTDLPHLKPKEN